MAGIRLDSTYMQMLRGVNGLRIGQVVRLLGGGSSLVHVETSTEKVVRNVPRMDCSKEAHKARVMVSQTEKFKRGDVLICFDARPKERGYVYYNNRGKSEELGPDQVLILPQ